MAPGNCLNQDRGRLGQIIGNSFEFFACAKAAFIHIKSAAHLNLQRMAIICWVAIMLGNKAAGVGLIALHNIAVAAQFLLDGIDKICAAARAKTIADDEIGLARRIQVAKKRRVAGAPDA